MGPTQSWDDNRTRSQSSAPLQPGTAANANSAGAPFLSPRKPQSYVAAASNVDQTPQRPRPPPMPKNNQQSPGVQKPRPATASEPRVRASPQRPSAPSSSPFSRSSVGS